MGKKTLKQLYKILDDKNKRADDNKYNSTEQEKYGQEAYDVSQLILNEEIKLINFLRNKSYSKEEKKDIFDKIQSRKIMSKKDIPPPKKADSESDKENKKPEIPKPSPKTVSKVPKSVSKSVSNSLTKTQQNNLIRKIPDDMFTREEILKIVEHIRNGTMTEASQMPNPTKKEPKVPLDDVVLDKKKKIKGGALKAVVKQGRPKKIKTEEQIKAEEKAIADKLKAKEAKLKPYFKIGEIPKGFRRASMLEAKEAGKINYWGIKQVDNKILTLTEETDPKKIKAKIAEKTVKLGGLMGKFSKIKKDIVTAKNKNDNKAEVKLNGELDELKKVILQSNNELTALKEKLKKRSGTGLPNTNTDDDEDSDDDNAN